MRRSRLLFSFVYFAAGLAIAAPPLIYVTNSDDSKISVIDPATDTVVREIAVSANPHGIVPSPDGKRFYISSESKDLLDVVDRASGKVIRSVPIGLRPNNVAITEDGKRVYVCIRGKSQVDIIDTESLTRVKSVEVGKGPHNVYRSPDGKLMIATSMEGEKITAIDVKTEEPTFAFEPGGVPRPLIMDANPDKSIRRLFVQLSNLHGFEVIDWASRKVTQKVELPVAPPDAKPLIPATFSHGMGISPDRRTLWVDDMLNNTVNVFSMKDLKPVAVIPVGRGPDWMIFTPDGKRCYVSNAGANSVSSIDARTFRELKQIPVGKVPKRIIVAD
jgi:YVTN family beta-propeller protein